MSEDGFLDDLGEHASEAWELGGSIVASIPEGLTALYNFASMPQYNGFATGLGVMMSVLAAGGLTHGTLGLLGMGNTRLGAAGRGLATLAAAGMAGLVAWTAIDGLDEPEPRRAVPEVVEPGAAVPPAGAGDDHIAPPVAPTPTLGFD
ncbi:MAG TPA: hypothetical protein EYG18_09985 [Micavibrio sp.]|nr:hypothetical protein [Pseudomonadota bacterium]HIF26087.1 hypothetical protein [Micavibrio sp.]HIL29586.1 hypothetical protein [Micavibrio sp.]